MSQEDLKRVGEPFFTTKDSGRGMGLGLFIAKLFTERLGGTFDIVSTLGMGTRVEMQLPRVTSWKATP
jgi:two-component system sensor histidine kinase RegB